MGSYVTTYFHKRHLLLRYFRWKQGTLTKHPTRPNTAPQPLVKAWPPLKLEPPCLKAQSRSGLISPGGGNLQHWPQCMKGTWNAAELGVLEISSLMPTQCIGCFLHQEIKANPKTPHRLGGCGDSCSSRLTSHSEVELLVKEVVVGLGDMQADAIESYPILLLFLG